MKSGKLLASATAMLVHQAIFVEAQAKSAQKPVKLEGMEYSKARKVIVGYGWSPLRGNCGEAESTCAAYPEVGNCSAGGFGFCDMAFVGLHRCLIVVTVGGAPRRNEHGEPVVRDVQFRRGSCSKD
jgi:hypothetical protein